MQIVIAGKPEAPDTRALLREVHRRYLPAKILVLADGGMGQKFVASRPGFPDDMPQLQGRATAYLCKGLIQFLLRVHDDGAAPGDWLMQQSTGSSMIFSSACGFRSALAICGHG